MATLNFEKQGNQYIAETEVVSDFNLHIEKGNGGNINLQVRTSPGGGEILYPRWIS